MNDDPKTGNADADAGGTTQPQPTPPFPDASDQNNQGAGSPAGKGGRKSVRDLWGDLENSERITAGLGFATTLTAIGSLFVAILGYQTAVNGSQVREAIGQLANVAVAQQDEVNALIDQTNALDNEVTQAARQADAAGNEVAEMRRQTTSLATQAKAAQDQLGAINEATIRANRAWITVLAVNVRDRNANRLGDRLAVNVLYSNTGREPALDVRSSGQAFWVYLNQRVFAQRMLDQSKISIAPNDTCKKPNPTVIGSLPSGPVTPAVSPGLGALTIDGDYLSDVKFFAYRGCFTYSTFGQTHRTAFCYVQFPQQDPVTKRLVYVWESCWGAGQNFAD